jgi:2',3'-cyclic-nucleotide 2'-phosphodiesterase/3'-nucleotidase
VKTAGPVVFHSRPASWTWPQAAGLHNVSLLRADDGKGFAVVYGDR